jgi:uncharacterized protein
MKSTSLTFLALVALAAPLGAQTLVSQWTFNSTSPDGNTATGVSTPAFGSGTASLLGTTVTFASGAGSTDPDTADDSAWNTTAYPFQSTDSGLEGVRFDVSTVGFSNAAFGSLDISFDIRTSNTASRWIRMDYTVDGGSAWTLGTPVRLGTAANAGDTWHNGQSFSVADAAAFENASFGFRVVSVFSPVAFTEVQSGTNFAANTAYEVARNTTSTYGGGTMRYDMVTLSAAPIPEPASAAALGGLGALALAGLRRRRRA